MRLSYCRPIVGLLLLTGTAAAASRTGSPAPVRVAQHGPGMISAADPRAAEAGAQMLREGGSAVDAAFATLLALNVVEPQSSGIGGGGYLVYSFHGASPVTYDGRETAPHAAAATWFFRNGQPMRHDEAIPGGKSVGVPGNLQIMGLTHKRCGKLPWKALLRHAIRLPRDGFMI